MVVTRDTEAAIKWLREFLNVPGDGKVIVLKDRLLKQDEQRLTKRFEDTAVRELKALDVPETTGAIAGYCDKLSKASSSESLIRFNWGEVRRTIIEDIFSTPCERLAELPLPGVGDDAVPNRSTLDLEDDQVTDFCQGIVKLVSLRLLHERALGARERYLELESERPPRKHLFYRELSLRTIRWDQTRAQSEEFPRDRFIGESAAETSDEMLFILQAQLEFIGEITAARAGYTRRKGPPKQLGICKEILHSLRHRLGESGSELARSKVVFATLTIFGGELFPLHFEGITEGARNIVERERYRLPDELMEDTEQRYLDSKAVEDWARFFMRIVGSEYPPNISVSLATEDEA
jgi:hypothetical protein